MVPALGRAVEITDIADSVPEGFYGSGLCLAQVHSELGERHLDGGQVGGIQWQEQEPRAFGPKQFGGARAFVR